MKTNTLLLVFILICGLILRIMFLKDNALTFGFDQARDAFIAKEILNGDLKILGPSASTPGLYHGVLYYYLIAPSYWIGQGSPIVTAIWIAFINVLTIIPIYFLGKVLFSMRVGILAAFLFAISFDSVQYATWLSNPTPAVFSGALFYLGLGLLIFSKKINLGIILTAIGLGLSTQFEIFLGYLVLPLLICIRVFKFKPTFKQVALFLGLFVLTTSTMVISYVKFGPTFLQGFTSLALGKEDPFSAWREFAPALGLYLNRFGEYFYRGLLPFNVAIGGLIGLVMVGFCIYWARNDKTYSKQILFLLILLFSHGFLIPFGGNSTPFINAGLQAVVMLLAAYFIFKTISKNKLLIGLLVFLIVFSSVGSSIKYNNFGSTVFAVQRGLILRNELTLIDYTYQASDMKPFSVNTVTSPLWINTVWSYLYNYYGDKKYGYVPSFHGRDQSGYLGELPKPNQDIATFFLILEPAEGIPRRYFEDTIGYENTFSELLEEKNFGGILVQKRKLTKSFKDIDFIR